MEGIQQPLCTLTRCEEVSRWAKMQSDSRERTGGIWGWSQGPRLAAKAPAGAAGGLLSLGVGL